MWPESPPVIPEGWSGEGRIWVGVSLPVIPVGRGGEGRIWFGVSLTVIKAVVSLQVVKMFWGEGGGNQSPGFPLNAHNPFSFLSKGACTSERMAVILHM